MSLVHNQKELDKMSRCITQTGASKCYKKNCRPYYKGNRMKFRKINDIYFVGIGGIGMSGIAELLHNLDFNISGSDLSDNENVNRLQKLGINITIGHSREI